MPLKSRHKSGISSNRRRPKPTLWAPYVNKGQLGELGAEEEEEEEPVTEQRREYTDLGLDLGKREDQLPCLSLNLGHDRRRTSESGDVSLTIFIASVSGS